MTVRKQCFAAALALCATLGVAQAADAPQRLALACSTASQCGAQARVSTRDQAVRHGEVTVAKKAARRATPAAAPVNYERDLWRHQSAS